jgi:hypothetical protein
LERNVAQSHFEEKINSIRATHDGKFILEAILTEFSYDAHGVVRGMLMVLSGASDSSSICCFAVFVHGVETITVLRGNNERAVHNLIITCIYMNITNTVTRCLRSRNKCPLLGNGLVKEERE